MHTLDAGHEQREGGCKMSLGTRYLVGLVALVMMLGVGARAADYPDCRWNCRSNDVALKGVYLDESSTCTPGQTVQATLYGVFVNGTGTDRHDVALIADLVITTISGTATTRLNVTNLTSLIPPGTSDLPIAEISFPCEASIELRGIIVSWDTKTGGDLTCPSRTAKCTYTAQVIVRAAPLVVDFTSSAPVCQGTSVSFVSKTSGGTPPYSSYLWDFGDGVGTSTNVNPSHTYSSAGTYTVSLTVVDEEDTSTASHSVVIYALLPATASNGGPYCNDDAIELYASGGANYAWAGPSEFTSTEQNPVVSGGAPGIYTVTVASSFGCSSTASTQVVVDSSPPVLTIPADQTVECGLDFSPSTTGSASALDVTGAAVTVSYSDVFSADECGDGTGSIERTWSAASSCGNTTHAIQTITIVDTTAPSLTISSATLECDGAGNADDIEAWLLSAITTDACGSVSVSHDYAGLTATCPGVGEAIVTFVAVDLCGNSAQRTSTLRVLDTTSPVAEADLATVEAGASILIDVTGNDSDVCSAELTLISVGHPVRGSAVLVGGEVEYTAPAAAGVDSFTYIIEDCSGLRGTGQVTITVLPSNDAPSANDAVV
ncbi:PKD domain-containing protein, partial [Candidatus Bipolaricaulota bacterium]|nr:PKD domain-containing protein [Candidatus Bipolaricaulota bacterium]